MIRKLLIPILICDVVYRLLACGHPHSHGCGSTTRPDIGYAAKCHLPGSQQWKDCHPGGWRLCLRQRLLGSRFPAGTLSEPVAFGDLNYDGRQDAAVLLAENMGGTGVFVSLIAVLDDGGAPRQVASVFIDDRPMINMLVIQSGEILLEAVLHGADDPMCCPEQQSQRGYRLYTDQLVLTRLSDETTTGIMRSIDITSPIDLEEKEYPVAVSGSVTIGPFESTLAYNIYDPANILVTAGSVMTDSPDMGLPGNFSLSVDLTMAGVSGNIRMEFVEYSMADGSVLTLDSVLVRVP